MQNVKNNRDLARDPKTNCIVNVNDLEYQKYISSRSVKQKRNESLDSMKNEMNEIKSLLKELVNGN